MSSQDRNNFLKLMEESLEKLKQERNQILGDISKSSTFIELPKYIQKKKAVVNIQSNDCYSFLWSVIAALHPIKQNVCKTSSYPHFSDVLHYDGIDFPIMVKDISNFERMYGLSVNVYGLKNTQDEKQDQIVPIRVSRILSRKPVINLLMITKNANDFIRKTNQYLKDNTICHFTWIRNLQRLVSSQNGKRHRSSWLC